MIPLAADGFAGLLVRGVLAFGRMMLQPGELLVDTLDVRTLGLQHELERQGRDDGERGNLRRLDATQPSFGHP
jgi:hypothetical protein